jgi:MFS family permease
MIRFPHRHAPRLLAFFTSLIMSFIMSMVITVLNLGWVEEFLERWMHAWASAFLIAFPTILLVLPIARALVTRLTHPAPTTRPQRKG